MSRRFTFIGVSTGGSSIMRVFPRWRDALGLGADVSIEGWDLPVGAAPEEYRATVDRLAGDPDNLGALVTTHKIGIFSAAADRFDELDENATLLGEISCISKRGTRLLGHAKDAFSAPAALERIIPPDHFSGGGAAMVLGAGGAGAAIAVYLGARRGDRPQRLIVTDTDRARRAHVEAIAAELGAPIEALPAEGGGNERLLAELPPGSLIVNATGMGKDRPGSPLPAGARFPEGSAVWELNYRGELDFLQHAKAQEAAGGLIVADGWEYFIRGWAAVIEEVFQHPLGEADLELLSGEAIRARNEEGTS